MKDMIENVRERVIALSEAFCAEGDGYDFWNEHIKLVEYYAVQLAGTYGADREVVQLGALLHDLALITQTGSREEHHIVGAKLAQELLQSLGYPKTKQVVSCVAHHRSSRDAQSVEETCVADADILSHFANIPMIFQVGFVLKKKTLRQVKADLRQELQADFDDLSERTKRDFEREYQTILRILVKDIELPD